MPMSACPPRVGAAERRAISFGGPVRLASWWAILAHTRRRMGKDNLSALAAGAAFQSVISLFPPLTAVVSVNVRLRADRQLASRLLGLVVVNGDVDYRRQHLLRRGGEARLCLIQPSCF